LQHFRRIQNENRNFDNIQQLVDALLDPPTVVNNPQPAVEVERVGPIEGQNQPVQVFAEPPTSTLKRNSVSNEQTNNDVEPMEGEAPLKRCKTGSYFWLVTSFVCT